LVSWDPKDHDLPYLSVHRLCHTWATLALQAGVHPKVVQERLGHSTIAITLDIYSHVNPAMDAEAADTVADLIKNSPARSSRDRVSPSSFSGVRQISVTNPGTNGPLRPPQRDSRCL
jgi:hypothetical protein